MQDLQATTLYLPSIYAGPAFYQSESSSLESDRIFENFCILSCPSRCKLRERLRFCNCSTTEDHSKRRGSVSYPMMRKPRMKWGAAIVERRSCLQTIIRSELIRFASGTYRILFLLVQQNEKVQYASDKIIRSLPNKRILRKFSGLRIHLQTITRSEVMYTDWNVNGRLNWIEL